MKKNILAGTLLFSILAIINAQLIEAPDGVDGAADDDSARFYRALPMDERVTMVPLEILADLQEDTAHGDVLQFNVDAPARVQIRAVVRNHGGDRIIGHSTQDVQGSKTVFYPGGRFQG